MTQESKVKTIKVLTLNLHKGFGFLTREVVIEQIRKQLEALDADLLFLQEVVGENNRIKSKRWPKHPQYQFLAHTAWEHSAYGKNAIYSHGHHGNAILSRFPITSWENIDISASKFEQRGLLHARLIIKGETVHAVCLHLGLLKRWRKSQLHATTTFLLEQIPQDEPLILAGDFNDFSNASTKHLLEHLRLNEVRLGNKNRKIKTYPALFPLFSFDRIYVRGFEIVASGSFKLGRGLRTSDHSGVIAEVVRNNITI